MASLGDRILRRILQGTARLLLRRGDGEAIPVSALRRILVVRLDDRVGNALLTTPLLRALREGLPHVRLDVLMAPRALPVVDGTFLADEWVAFDRRWIGKRPWAAWQVLRRLRDAHYDLVIDAAHWHVFSTSSAAVTRWLGPRWRIGSDRGGLADRFYTHPVAISDDVHSDVEGKLQLLAPLGLPHRGLAPETSAGWRDVDADAARHTMSTLDLAPRKFWILNPGARKPDRRVAPDRLGRLVRDLFQRTGLRTLVVWGPGEEALARSVCDAAGDGSVYAPDTNLGHLAALLRQSRGCVTHDTGPMHLSVACACPTVALFAVDDADRWGHAIPTFRAVQVPPSGDDWIDTACASVEAVVAAAPHITEAS